MIRAVLDCASIGGCVCVCMSILSRTEIIVLGFVFFSCRCCSVRLGSSVFVSGNAYIKCRAVPMSARFRPFNFFYSSLSAHIVCVCCVCLCVCDGVRFFRSNTNISSLF